MRRQKKNSRMTVEPTYYIIPMIMENYFERLLENMWEELVIGV